MVELNSNNGVGKLGMVLMGGPVPSGPYTIVDNRPKPRKELSQLESLKKLGVKFSTNKAMVPAESISKLVVQIPLHRITTSVKDFQNRKKHYSSESVNKIVEAVKVGSFDFAMFDPITVWDNPAKKLEKFIVLSGHSRFEAFNRLVKLGHDEFAKIPAKVFRGSFEEAQELALNSNTLSTKESYTERANYYRDLRLKGASLSELVKLSKQNEGRDSARILAYSFLSKSGIVLAALQALEAAEDTSRNNILTIAQWIGNTRLKFTELTDFHEKELYEWLIESAYGTKAGQYSNQAAFIEAVQKLIIKNSTEGIFNSDKPLNPLKFSTKTSVEIEYDNKLNEIQKALKEATTERDNKRKEFAARGASQDAFNKAMQPYEAKIFALSKELAAHKIKYAQVIEASKNQTSLFGSTLKPFAFTKELAQMRQHSNLGAQAVLEQNKGWNFNGFKPSYKILNDYSHLITKPQGKTEVLHGNLNTTITIIKKVIDTHYKEVALLANHLFDYDFPQFCFNIWHWCTQNFQYGYDLGGEEIRTPSASFSNRNSRVDCEDFAILAASILKNMHYGCELYIVGFETTPTMPGEYHHIYVVAHNTVIDPVLKTFNIHPENIKRTMKIEVLSGVGLGSTTTNSIDSKLQAQKAELVKKLKETGNPALAAEIRKINYILLLEGEEKVVMLQVMPYLIDVHDSRFIFKEGAPLEEIAELIENLNAPELQGIGRIKLKLKTPIKKAVNNFKKKVTTTVKKVKNNPKDVLKKVGNAVLKVTPVVLLARTAFMGLLRLNAFGMAYKLGFGYLTEAEAKQLDLNIAAWRKAVKNTLEAQEKFRKLGGSEKQFKEAVLSGRKKGKRGKAQFSSLGEPATAALITAATPLVLALLPIINKNNPAELTNGREGSGIEKLTDGTYKLEDGTVLKPDDKGNLVNESGIAIMTVEQADAEIQLMKTVQRNETIKKIGTGIKNLINTATGNSDSTTTANTLINSDLPPSNQSETSEAGMNLVPILLLAGVAVGGLVYANSGAAQNKNSKSK